MSFGIFRKTETQSGVGFERIADLSLTGEDGIFARWLAGFREADTPFEWVLDVATVIALAGIDASEEEVVVLLDLSDGAQVSLNLVRGFRGASDEDSSDLVVNCTPLEGAEKRGNRIEMDGLIGRGEWLEALGLSGGTRGGRYFWRAPKMDIGAAVRPASAPPTNP